jgi:serine/threonine protein kinase
MEDPQESSAEAGDFSPADSGRPLDEEPQFVDAGETAPMATGDSIPDSIQRIPGVSLKIGRYEIRRRLGQGSMGAVYLAFDSQLHREVALKIPKFSEADGKEPFERFYREARLAATLSHPSICPVYDIGEADGTHYIAMAYIEGRPLTDYIRRDKPQPLKHVARTVCRIAMAVQEAHEHGVIHRDLKPDNIMIDENRKPVIMDFGLARRMFREGEDRLTHSGALVGSPAYMSPEQVEGDPAGITNLSDIFSLGVVFYEMMTGMRPFRGYVGAVLGKILHETPQPPSELRPDIDPKIEAICLRMMAKNPQERYASMDEVAHTLANYVRKPKESAMQPAPTIELPAFRPETLESLQANQPSQRESKSRAVEAAGEYDADNTAQSNAAACRTAQKLIDSHDYENAVELLQQVPQAQRNAEVIDLLGQARELRSLVKRLIADANRMQRNRDFYGMCRKLERLLEVKPNHQRARQLLEQLEQKGFSGVITGLSIERQVAEWILNSGGTVDVLIDGEPIHNVESIRSIPDAEFRVVSCGLSGCESVNDLELANIAGLSAIQNLSLAQTTTSDIGLKHVRRFLNLTSLLLAQTDVTGEGLRQLSGMSRLVKLDLANTKLGDADLAMLEPLESLEFLGLLGTKVTDASSLHLAHFTGLTFLDLYDTRFTATGITQLSKSLPNCRINY